MCLIFFNLNKTTRGFRDERNSLPLSPLYFCLLLPSLSAYTTHLTLYFHLHDASALTFASYLHPYHYILLNNVLEVLV